MSTRRPTGPFTVWTELGNSNISKVRDPHKVLDTRTNEIVDEYTSKRAAQMDVDFRNQQYAKEQS